MNWHSAKVKPQKPIFYWIKPGQKQNLYHLSDIYRINYQGQYQGTFPKRIVLCQLVKTTHYWATSRGTTCDSQVKYPDWKIYGSKTKIIFRSWPYIFCIVSGQDRIFYRDRIFSSTEYFIFQGWQWPSQLNNNIQMGIIWSIILNPTYKLI